MDSITPYESAKGSRYRVRNRKPDHTEAEKRGFTTIREAKLYLSMVTVSKSKGEYIDPHVVASADPDVRRQSAALQAAADAEALVLHDARAGMEKPRRPSLGRSGDPLDPPLRSPGLVSEFETRKSSTVVIRALGVLAGILDVAIDDRRLASNPARNIRNLPRKGPGKRRV